MKTKVSLNQQIINDLTVLFWISNLCLSNHQQKNVPLYPLYLNSHKRKIQFENGKSGQSN
jgi:hypothetical protein